MFICDAPQLHLHLHSYHQSETKFNNRTPGIGLMCDVSPTSKNIVGIYHNSINRPSVYVGRTWQPWSVGPMQVGMYGGAVTGYRNHPIPFVAGIVSYPINERVSFNTTIIPHVKGITPITVHWSLSWRF